MTDAARLSDAIQQTGWVGCGLSSHGNLSGVTFRSHPTECQIVNMWSITQNRMLFRRR
jgi:hypothetical protein